MLDERHPYSTKRTHVRRSERKPRSVNKTIDVAEASVLSPIEVGCLSCNHTLRHTRSPTIGPSTVIEKSLCLYDDTHGAQQLNAKPHIFPPTARNNSLSQTNCSLSPESFSPLDNPEQTSALLTAALATFTGISQLQMSLWPGCPPFARKDRGFVQLYAL